MAAANKILLPPVSRTLNRLLCMIFMNEYSRSGRYALRNISYLRRTTMLTIVSSFNAVEVC